MTSWFASVALVASLMIPGVSSGAQKRVVLNSACDHDRWGTVHADITRNYRAYTTRFDSGVHATVAGVILQRIRRLELIPDTG